MRLSIIIVNWNTGQVLLDCLRSIAPHPPASTRRFPSFRAVLHHYTILRHLHVFRRPYENGSMADFSHDRQREVDQLLGSALLVRRAALDQVGLAGSVDEPLANEAGICVLGR